MLKEIIIISIIFSYFYLSAAFYFIGKRAKIKYPEIAWLPGLGLFIIANRVAKKHWWPLILLIIAFFPFFISIPYGNVIAIIISIISGTYSLMWMAKTFKRLRRPAWWTISLVLPGIGVPLFFTFIGIAAWGKIK